MTTRTLAFGPNKPCMEVGPYLVFVRSRIAFSDHHDFQDWPFLATGLSGMMWGVNAVAAYIPHIQGFADMGDIPEWVEFIEVASIAPEIGAASYSEECLDDSDDDDIYSSCMVNLMRGANVGAISEKPCFDKRLVLVSLCDDATDRVSVRLLDRLKSFLGHSARGVWHSSDLIGIAFRDSRSPDKLAQVLERVLREDNTHDFGVFKIADVAPESGVPSPFVSFLTGR